MWNACFESSTFCKEQQRTVLFLTKKYLVALIVTDIQYKYMYCFSVILQYENCGTVKKLPLIYCKYCKGLNNCTVNLWRL